MRECEEFSGFLPFQQSAPYAAAAAACGARVRWCDLDGGRALVIERGRLRLVSRGPVWADDCTATDQRAGLRRVARWQGLTIATPETAVQGWGLIPLITPRHHAVWTLGPQMRAGLAGKWRNRLAAAGRAGVVPRPAPHARLAALVEAEAAQRRSRGYRSLPPAFSAAIPPDALRLWEWQHDGDNAAAMAFVVHGGTATYHLAWGNEAARTTGAHALMLLQAAEALQQEGVRWLDLGSVDTDRAPGVARFKLGTGAALKRLGATVMVLP